MPDQKLYMLAGPGWQTKPHTTLEAAQAEAEALGAEADRKAFVEGLKEPWPADGKTRVAVLTGEVGTWEGIRFVERNGDAD